MKEVYILKYGYEDDERIYGIYDDYNMAELDLNTLRKYNEAIKWGELEIDAAEINKLYVNEDFKFIMRK